MIKKIIFTLTKTLLGNCTNRGLYKSFQRNSCKQQINERITYDEYTKERKNYVKMVVKLLQDSV